MSKLLDAFWRAAAYCLHPRVIGLSLLPLVIMAGTALAAGYFFWDAAVNGVFLWLEGGSWLASIVRVLQDMGLDRLKNVLAPLIVIVAVTPVIVIGVLLLVAWLMMPAIVRLVARRRFPELERKQGASMAMGVLWSIGSTLLALVATVVSLPLWLVPPLILVIPALIWGWLTYRVMAFDALADHASADERHEIFRRHRLTMLVMGVTCGFMGAAPSIVWASGWFFVAAFVLLAPVAIWIYTLVFAFSSLWFAHFTLAELQALRAERAVEQSPPAPTPAPAPLALADDRSDVFPRLAGDARQDP